MENLEKLNYNPDEWYFTVEPKPEADKKKKSKKTKKAPDIKTDATVVNEPQNNPEKERRHTKWYWPVAVLLLLIDFVSFMFIEDTDLIMILSVIILVLVLVVWFVDRRIMKKRAENNSQVNKQ